MPLRIVTDSIESKDFNAFKRFCASKLKQNLEKNVDAWSLSFYLSGKAVDPQSFRQETQERPTEEVFVRLLIPNERTYPFFSLFNVSVCTFLSYLI